MQKFHYHLLNFRPLRCCTHKNKYKKSYQSIRQILLFTSTTATYSLAIRLHYMRVTTTTTTTTTPI